ncbi:MAG: type II toxin-antitoxin system RelE/ParE family toxin [Clostridia bacterium]|nr:type II toxin-antitoxin system RelE/ParE family toxin [Clostridia bacterium]
MPLYEILFYEKENGEEPAKVFIEGLPAKLKAKTLHDLNLLRAFGPNARLPLSRSLGDGIFELRTVFSSDISRILYFFYEGQRIILTNGFIKKQQQTPHLQIDRARRYRADFLDREV